MRINFITGGVSSGKTYECIRKINEINEIKAQAPQARVVMIVPEQYSYAAERLMTENFGGTGLNNIEVLTFSRMSKRSIARAVKNYLTPSGKAILLTRAIENACKDGSIYSGCATKPGFVNTASTMLWTAMICRSWLRRLLCTATTPSFNSVDIQKSSPIGAMSLS